MARASWGEPPCCANCTLMIGAASAPALSAAARRVDRNSTVMSWTAPARNIGILSCLVWAPQVGDGRSLGDIVRAEMGPDIVARLIGQWLSERLGPRADQRTGPC